MSAATADFALSLIIRSKQANQLKVRDARSLLVSARPEWPRQLARTGESAIPRAAARPSTPPAAPQTHRY